MMNPTYSREGRNTEVTGTPVQSNETYLQQANINQYKAVAQRLVTVFSPRGLVFASGQHVGFVVDKAALGQVFFEYFGFPCHSFYQFLCHHNHPGSA
jgi:hypothetical protein